MLLSFKASFDYNSKKTFSCLHFKKWFLGNYELKLGLNAINSDHSEAKRTFV